MSLQKQQLVWPFYLLLVSTETCEYLSLMDINAVHSSGENFVSFVVVTNQNCIIFRALMILPGCPELVKYVCGLVYPSVHSSVSQPHSENLGGNRVCFSLNVDILAGTLCCIPSEADSQLPTSTR